MHFLKRQLAGGSIETTLNYHVYGAGWQINGPASDRGAVMKVNLSEGKLCIQPD